MPHAVPCDLEASVHRILETLARHRARAIFFAVGELAVRHPDLLHAIGHAGHEVALHGWRHESWNSLDGRQLAALARRLEQASAAVEDAVGRRPTGFRAPYLLAPHFFDAAVYELLTAAGFRWASNYELRHVLELARPDRIGTERPWRALASRPRLAGGRLAEVVRLAINAGVLFRPPRDSARSALRWVRAPAPFYRGSILELPLIAPLDCDLLGLPPPSTPTPAALLDYTHFALQACLAPGRAFSMVNFHDWLVGSGTRLELLEDLLTFLTSAGARTSGVEERWNALSALARATARP